MQEKRKSQRRKTFLGAKIAFHNVGSILTCMVRDISDTGAKLEFNHPRDVPDCFDLVITDKRQSFKSAVVWRRDKLVGVRFLAAKPQTISVLRRVA